MDRYRALVVADDLTGAADAGGRFAARGFETVVATGALGLAAGSGSRPTADVLAVDTDSRYVPPDVAAERIAAVVGSIPADVVYKKVDSTLRGNLVGEVDAAVAATGTALALVAPAFPAAGRTTVGGCHLVDGTPVSDTAAGDDPETSVATSDLNELFADSTHRVVHLPLETVAGGVDAVEEFLAARTRTDDGPLVVVCDAARTAHLDAVAAAGARREDVLYVGSAGLAGHVRLGASGGVLGVVGSTAPETLAQLERVPDAEVVYLADPLSDGTVERAVERAVEDLRKEGRVVVTAARTRADREATLEAGRSRGLTDAETSARVAAALGAVAVGVVAHAGTNLGGLFCTGGAVAKATLDALGSDGVRLAGHEVESGVPLGRLAGGTLDGTPVVTKAGGFGADATIVNCLDALALADD